MAIKLLQPIASVAKVMTAYAVLKQKPLSAGQQGPMITITAADVAIYNDYVAKDGSVAKVEQGEQISELPSFASHATAICQ